MLNAGTVIAMLGLGLVANLLQLLLSPLYLFSRQLSYRLNSLATNMVWGLCRLLFDCRPTVRLSHSGVDSIPMGEDAFIISNHVFFGDFFLIHSVAHIRHMMPYCRYYLKESLKYIPIFGWGMYLCNFPFLKRNWQRDANRLNHSLQTIIANRLPIWLVSHVEGTRFSASKQAEANCFADKQGMDRLQHILFPRCKGFVATVEALRSSHIQHLYDVTLAYHHRRRGFGAAPSLKEILLGSLDDYQFHVHVDRIPFSEIPREETKLCRWIYEKYYSKDRLMGQIKEAFANRLAKQC